MAAAVASDPDSCFSTAELNRRDAEAFATLRADGLLERVESTDGLMMRAIGDRVLAVTPDPRGDWEGFDPDDPGMPTVLLSHDEVDLWRLNLLKVTGVVAMANAVTPAPEMLLRRLILAGRPSRTTALCVGLVPDASTAMEVVAALPSLLAPEIKRTVVATFGFEPTQALRRAQPTVLWTKIADGFALDPPLSDLFPQAARQTAAAALRCECGWKHSPTLTWIEVDGRTLTQGSLKAAVLAGLHDSQGPVQESGLLEDIGSNSKRIRDLIRPSSGLIDTVIRHRGRGQWEFIRRAD